MSGSGTQPLFVLNLPDLTDLCCVNLFFSDSYEEGELRNKQVKTCRELVLLLSDIVASPVLGHYGGITVIMTTIFYEKGFIQAFAQQRGLQLSPPQKVFPAILQSCLSYSVIAKLAPKWNKAGPFLIAGKDFLSDFGKLNAVELELNITETQLCVIVEGKTVRLPPAEIQDFDFPSSVVQNFFNTNDAVIDTVIPNNWCHVLPSMKKGQIISISRRIPQESPFKSYREIQNHWNNSYGYQLPSVSEEDVMYCNVYFQPIGDKLFTYPLCCIRSQPIQCFATVNLQEALGTFISDLQVAMKSLCGFSVWKNCKPGYYSIELKRPVAQYSTTLPLNMMIENSGRAVLNQLPSSCPRDTTQHRYSQCDSTGKPAEKKRRLSLDSSLNQEDWTSSNLATQSSPSPPNVHFTHIQAQSALLRPKLVPILKSKSSPVNATEVLAAKQQTEMEEQKPTAVIRPLSSTSLSTSSKSHCSTSPAHSYQFKRITRFPVFVQANPQIVPEIPSNKGVRYMFQSRPKRLKQSLLDVEYHTMDNQLANANSATLCAWLRSRGIYACSKVKKEGLISKVLRSLNES